MPGTSVDLEVDFSGPPPVSVAYRNQGNAWQVPAAVPDNAGHYTLSIAHVYEYLVVCAQGSSFDAELYGATVGDSTKQYAECVLPTPSPSTVNVEGTTVQAATVTMGGETATTTAGGGFTLQVSNGSNDLMAYDASSVLVERDQVIDGATNLPPLDLATSGSPLEQLTLSINNRRPRCSPQRTPRSWLPTTAAQTARSNATRATTTPDPAPSHWCCQTRSRTPPSTPAQRP
jgi:hypothetical protein